MEDNGVFGRFGLFGPKGAPVWGSGAPALLLACLNSTSLTLGSGPGLAGWQNDELTAWLSESTSHSMAGGLNNNVKKSQIVSV